MHQPATAAKTRSHHSPSSWLACTGARSFPQSASLPPIDRKRLQVPSAPRVTLLSLIFYPRSSPSLLLWYSIRIVTFVNVVIFQHTFPSHQAHSHRCLTTIVTHRQLLLANLRLFKMPSVSLLLCPIVACFTYQSMLRPVKICQNVIPF